MSFPNTFCSISCHFVNASLCLSLHLNIFPVYRHLRRREKSTPGYYFAITKFPDYYFAILSHLQIVPQVGGPPVTLPSPGISHLCNEGGRTRQDPGLELPWSNINLFFPGCFKLPAQVCCPLPAQPSTNPVQDLSCSFWPPVSYNIDENPAYFLCLPFKIRQETSDLIMRASLPWPNLCPGCLDSKVSHHTEGWWIKGIILLKVILYFNY